ncbi:hypothetical protein C2E20_6347 [Micractinium conductrix]|uniref:Rhodanese domain-containing protein n=1 Tax=Micractinium conductrix TaxID=554055 RepID=A0A2P6V7S8_9CHLO|nr:hypothetical protein C2E20_6347 [Micractinium conductrix]|eukprot:PSC70141.1 hypothetical protein C2E20_6347 [Micractinium conductrix]
MADTDLGALFRDALATPAAAPVKKAAAAPTPAATSVAAEAAPPAASVTVDPVPGTEILSGAPQPQAPPAPTQGMDFVLEQLQSKPPGYDSPAAGAAKAAKPLGDGFAGAGKGLGDGLSSAGKGLGDAGTAATKGLSSAADSVTDSVGAVFGGAADAAADAQAALADTTAQAAAAAAAAAEAARGALEGVLGGAQGALDGAAGGAVGAAQQFVGAAAAEFNTEVSILKGNLDSLVGGVQSAVGGATSAVSSQVGAQVSGVAEQVSSLLPPEARDALAEAGAAASSVAGKLSGLDPTAAAVLAGVGLGVPAVAAWNAAYGGFAGVLAPEDALQVLQTQDALLLDIRPEAQRVDKGVAELRRGALGKGAAVPPVRLLPSVGRRVRDPSGVALEIQALEVAALAKVRAGSTKVIVMDQQGEAAKVLARALRAAGVRRPYVLAGGFKAWEAAGLGVRQAVEYDASPLDAVGDVAETVVEAAASQLSGLQDPRAAATLACVLGSAAYVAANYHTALQFVGVLGLELTLVSRALQYNSLQDAYDDVVALYQSATTLATLPLKAAEALQGRAAGGGQQAAGKGEA